MEQVRLGIIGAGVQGSYHIRYLMQGAVPQIRLSAVCDIDPEKLERARTLTNGTAALYTDAQTLMHSGTVDAVLISTPHYMHPVLAMQALDAGLHIMVEKPAGVYVKNVRKLNEKAEKSGKVFGMMFNQRTNPLYSRLRELVQSGRLGELRRVNWIITDWYRPQYYYDNGDWRATWAGEGGGVLLNQNPHNLDLWQWICGMPKRVFALCENGKYHRIEVEDDVTVLAEYPNGATGVYITTTGEAPGTNRLEITGSCGKAVVEDRTLKVWTLDTPEPVFSQTCRESFGAPRCTCEQIEPEGEETAHPGILRDWAEAILHGTPLLAPGVEGIRALQISNAIHLSAWQQRWVDVPADEDVFLAELNKRIASSHYHRGKEYEGC